MAFHGPARGFTLVELLVSLFAMSLIAILSWRGLDGMTRAQAATQTRADEVLTLQTGLAQWTADLDALVQMPQFSALEWNGRVLRMTRRANDGGPGAVVVAAWTRRATDAGSAWLRWQSAPVATRGELAEAWQRADTWSQSPGDADRQREVVVVPLEDWQIFFYRSDAWTNPLSSDATAQRAGAGGVAPTTGAPLGANVTILPDGVRLVLDLPAGQAINGRLTRDWVRPTVGGGKS